MIADINVLQPSTVFPLLKEMDHPFVPELWAKAIYSPKYDNCGVRLDGAVVFRRYLVFLDLFCGKRLTWGDGETYKDCPNYIIE